MPIVEMFSNDARLADLTEWTSIPSSPTWSPLGRVGTNRSRRHGRCRRCCSRRSAGRRRRAPSRRDGCPSTARFDAECRSCSRPVGAVASALSERLTSDGERHRRGASHATPDRRSGPRSCPHPRRAVGRADDRARPGCRRGVSPRDGRTDAGHTVRHRRSSSWCRRRSARRRHDSSGTLAVGGGDVALDTVRVGDYLVDDPFATKRFDLSSGTRRSCRSYAAVRRAARRNERGSPNAGRAWVGTLTMLPPSCSPR